MGSYENIVKLEEIRKKTDEGDYVSAQKILDTLDRKKIKNAADLSLMAEVCIKNEHYDEAMELLLKIYEKSKTRKIVYQLIETSILRNNIAEAEKYLLEYEKIAPKDFEKYIFRYKIDKLKQEPFEKLIETLETLKNTEYMEQWAYELAKLYYKAGMEEECIRECSDIVLWFGDGIYVEKAKMLKAYYSGETDKDKIIEELKRRAEQSVPSGEPEAYDEPDIDDSSEKDGLQEEALLKEDVTGYDSDFDSDYDYGEEPVNPSEDEMIRDIESMLTQDFDSSENDPKAEVVTYEDGSYDSKEDTYYDQDWDSEKEYCSEYSGPGAAAEPGTAAESDITAEPGTAADFSIAAEPDITAEPGDSAGSGEAAEPETNSEVLDYTGFENETEVPENEDTQSIDVPEDEAEAKVPSNSVPGKSYDKDEVEETLYQLLKEEEQDEDDKCIRDMSEKLGFSLEDIFSNFLHVKTVKKQLVKSLEMAMDKHTKSIQIMITGAGKSGKTTLAKDFTIFFNKAGKLKSTKVAKIQADKMNGVDVMAKKGSLKDCCLIIENASELNKTAIDKLLELIQYFRGDIIVIFEENKKNINKLFRECPRLMDVFKNRIHLPQYTPEELLGFAQACLSMKEYRLSTKAHSVMESKIYQIAKSTEPDKQLETIQELMVSAISAADVRIGKQLSGFAGESGLKSLVNPYILPEDFGITP